ncbi:odorant receptor 85c isoform X2 [Spodoptera frugiperda]|uniref:Odorant receptor n=1 Tax=Spodoptera frugiperda TaxID=7108 RepID=A0A9R0ECA3_SPOFR|nr:odorant receptor 85c isoform X2 [Spodoptera frugiperda]
MFSLDTYAGDAVVGITGPMDYKYMKVLRFVLRIISGWPGKALGEKTLMIEGMGHAYYNTILSLIYLALGVAYLKKNAHRFGFLELGQLYIVLLMNMLSTIHITVHRISYFSAVYVSIMLSIAACLFNLIPMYNNYAAGNFESFDTLQNKTYEQAISCLYPWNFETNFKGYLVATLSGWYGTVLCGSSVSMFDLFLCLMIFNLWGHFKILIYNLDHFPRPASEVVDAEGEERSGRIIGSEMYSESELEEVAVKLKECIQYHMLIVDFTNNMSDAFGMALFIYYSFHQITGCLLLLECSQMTAAALSRYLPLTIIMFGELVLLSIIFETIGTMSEKLKDAVYKMPWEYMDTKNRRTVLIFLIKVQEPIHVKAGGLVDVGVTTMASILKTSFSYFAFLRTF